MIKRYYSKYTGKEIDEAVGAIVNNDVTLSDLSPELIAEIKQWIHNNEQISFNSHKEFPNVGKEGIIYVALNERQMYFWENTHYVPFTADISNIDLILCGGAK